MRFGALLLALCTLPLASAGAGADATAAKDPRNFSWVEPGVLAIGGGGLNESEVDWLYAQGFRAIADFRVEHKDPAAHIAALGMSFYDEPIDSASHINETQFASFVAWARGEKAAGRPIYIHCTNGWHRAAAFAIAWRLAELDATFDEAARAQTALRPGTAMRATSGLLDYEATLRGGPQLAVVLSSNLTHPAYNESMNASVHVFAAGAPVPGAAVRVWSEESKLRVDGVTDESGAFGFVYTAPKPGTFMDHVYARASLDGSADGADNIEFLYVEPGKARDPLEVTAARVGDALVAAARSAGKPIAARIVATAPGWTGFESSAQGRVRFPDAPADAITVRAFAWGAEVGAADVVALPPPPAPPPVEPEPVVEPAPKLDPEPEPAPAPAAPSAPAEGSLGIPGRVAKTLGIDALRAPDTRMLGAGAAALGALATGLLLYVRRRAAS